MRFCKCKNTYCNNLHIIDIINQNHLSEFKYI